MKNIGTGEISKIAAFQPYLDGRPDLALFAERGYAAHPDLKPFVETLLTTGIMLVFDYNAWIRESGTDIYDADKLDTYDLLTLRKILTAHFRMDRFEEGHFEQLIQSGYMAAYVRALAKFMEE